MSYPNLRSMNGELNQGATEGTYKTVINSRGGVVESTGPDAREDLNDTWFGIHEAEFKRRPDGPLVTTPYYRATKPVHLPSGFVGH